MIRVADIEDVRLLRETVEVECKRAVGRDGKGQLPADFWPTYSAFANTRGGVIILGLREHGFSFEAIGISNPEKLRSDLFNQLNNRQKVSANLLSDDNFQVVLVDGKSVIIIEVPAAGRRDRPVHINSNPLTGTYVRLNDGDRLAHLEAVKRMLAEQTEDSRDNRVLKGFGYYDLDQDTIRAFRQMLRDRSPAHPFLDAGDLDFLRQIGAMRRDRETGYEGLTVAGLLMFGTAENVRDEFPNYFLDYQERSQPRAELRWIDRLTLDGTWSGNLFDFYRRVYRKLVTDLKVPFSLQNGQRQDETPIHEVLREALVNTIVHADYTGRASVLVVKRPDMFGFRNPGLMRVPIPQAIAGGESDGRNRTLQSMFLLVGAGERAGSGIPKIHKGWSDQHWRPPALYEREEPSEQTLLELRMIDLIPKGAIDGLRRRFGGRFDCLDKNQRLILAAAETEQFITHSRMLSICEIHPTDLTRTLQGLVRDGYLEQSGRTRGAVYRLPGTPLPSPETVFDPLVPLEDGSKLDGEGSDLQDEGSDLPRNGSNLSSEPSVRSYGRLVPGLAFPLIDDLDDLDPEVRRELEQISSFVRASARVPKDASRATIAQLCDCRYLTIKVLAALLGRDVDYLRQRVLNPLVEEQVIERAFPQAPNDPRQAYIASVNNSREPE